MNIPLSDKVLLYRIGGFFPPGPDYKVVYFIVDRKVFKKYI